MKCPSNGGRAEKQESIRFNRIRPTLNGVGLAVYSKKVPIGLIAYIYSTYVHGCPGKDVTVQMHASIDLNFLNKSFVRNLYFK